MCAPVLELSGYRSVTTSAFWLKGDSAMNTPSKLIAFASAFALLGGDEAAAQSVCDAPSFGLIRQTVAAGSPGPLAEGYVFGDEFEGGRRLTQWADMFGAVFPSRQGNSGDVAIRAGQFVALAFDIGTRSEPRYQGLDTGVLAMGVATSYSGTVLLSFSACPGDFSEPAAGSNRCRFMGGQGNFPWKLLTPGMIVETCNLSENATYYLNIAFVDPTTGATSCIAPSGETSACNVRLQTR